MIGERDIRRLDAALARLEAAGRLTAAQVAEVRREFAESPDEPTPGAGAASAPEHGTGSGRPPVPGPEPWRAMLPEIGGYIGGVFVIAATAVLVGPYWETIPRLLQVLLFAVPAALLFAAAVLIALAAPGGWNPRAGRVPTARRRVVAVLLIAGAVLGGGAAAVLADTGAADRVAFAGASVLLLAAYAFCRTALIQLAALLSCVFAVESWTAWAAHQLTGTLNPSVPIGAALCGLAVVWYAASVVGLIEERRLALVAACAVVFAAAEILAIGGESPGAVAAGYLLLALLAAGGLVGYLRTGLTGLLVVGVVALATVVPQAILEYTNGALGAGGALLVVGLSIIGASVLGFRLRRGEPSHDR